MKANSSIYADLHYFSEEEFSAPEEMDIEFLRRLDHARVYAGIAFKITSSFREDDDKTHGLGKAVDIACDTSAARFKMVMGARSAGFTRIGVYDEHVHFDTGTAVEGFPQDVLWWGVSK